jgi:hypothetical protein
MWISVMVPPTNASPARCCSLKPARTWRRCVVGGVGEARDVVGAGKQRSGRLRRASYRRRSSERVALGVPPATKVET